MLLAYPRTSIADHKSCRLRVFTKLPFALSTAWGAHPLKVHTARVRNFPYSYLSTHLNIAPLFVLFALYFRVSSLRTITGGEWSLMMIIVMTVVSLKVGNAPKLLQCVGQGRSVTTVTRGWNVEKKLYKTNSKAKKSEKRWCVTIRVRKKCSTKVSMLLWAFCELSVAVVQNFSLGHFWVVYWCLCLGDDYDPVSRYHEKSSF